jgi:ribosomal protection tetracycline resistance protein
MQTLNLGILAHVDAGKTSLTERLLYAAGVIDEIGSVDDGSTQTDSLALEQQRGITIKSAVVSFVVEDVAVNLIDTPGHPDFIAEVERVLSVLDGAVLVVSAVEGVQSQTGVLMRALQRLRVPTLLFVNTIARPGARSDGVLEGISRRLTPALVPLGSVRDLGTRAAGFEVWGAADAPFRESLVSVLAEHDDALMAAYVGDDPSISYASLREQLAAQTKRALVHPVLFGSAITGAGVDALMSGIVELLPAADGDADGPVSGTVFKIERGQAGEKIAYVRMLSGTLRTRERLRLRGDAERKVTAIAVFDRGSAAPRGSVSAGEIGKVWGLGEIQIGDAIGDAHGTVEHQFAPPTLETVVVPSDPAHRGALRVALAQLAEQDPLIDVRQDDIRQEISVSLYGEVQKEVIQATLADDFGLEVGFRETTTICIERPVGSGEAVELLGKGSNPFLATVGLRVEAGRIDSGLAFRLEVEHGSIPLYVYNAVDEFRKAVEEYVRITLREGLHGWQVRDCRVTMTQSGYASPATTAADFRKLTPLVLMSALQQAGTVVCEPMHRFHLELPADTFGAAASLLARLGAVPSTHEMRGAAFLLEGEIPAARVHQLQQQVPGATRGEGVLECELDHYEPIAGLFPSRPRTDLNPLNRKEYLLHVVRRV